ncbi:MAG TPA: hypothetical protein VGI93_23000 [Steroidobacteraceae bacterium]|jgi:hypothetical protein
MELRARSYTAGALLVAGSILEVIAMGHHPSVRTADVAAAVAAITALRTLSGVVHGILIALMLAIAYALSEFVQRRGMDRPLIRAGAISYGAGVIFMSLAALTSGFITPGVAAFTSHASATDLAINAQILTLCQMINQSTANAGAVAMSVGILGFSLDILKQARGRGIGLFGLLVGILPALLLPLGLAHLDVAGMTYVVILQGLWCVAVGVRFLNDPTGAWVRA